MPFYDAQQSNGDGDDVWALQSPDTDVVKDAISSLDKLSLSEADDTAPSPSSSFLDASESCPESSQASKSALPEDPFESAASKLLFEAIDKLQSCNARRYMNNIPQVSYFK